MLIVLPIDAAHPVRHNICAVRLILADGVAMLLAKLAKIAEHEMAFELRHEDSLPFGPHPERTVAEHQLIIMPPVEQWLKSFNNLWVQWNIVFHANLVLRRLYLQHWFRSP